MNEFFSQWDVAVILLQIIAIDLLLGGDNAVVIAMACRKLPPQQRTKAIIIGTFGAIAARVLLLAVAIYLLSLPWLKVVGALMLLWIGIKLVTNQEEESEVSSSSSLWRTAVTITVADVIMSLDNVLAVAAAGKGHLLLVALGVLIRKKKARSAVPAACGVPRSPLPLPTSLCRWITYWRLPPPGKAICCWSRWVY